MTGKIGFLVRFHFHSLRFQIFLFEFRFENFVFRVEISFFVQRFFDQ